MNAPVDLAAVKGRQQIAWASGDYAVIGTTLQIVGESLAEACDLRWDEDVLDVAAGNGNATLAAARRGARVTSTDYVSTLLDRGAERARAEGLDVRFQIADAEALPFDDASFDAVLSTFGVMFAPDHADGGLRNGARVPSRRTHRSCELDARRVHRADVQDAGSLPAAARGRAAAVALGRGSASPVAVRRRRRRRSSRHRRCSTSAIGRPRTSSTCSRRGTARCSRPIAALPADKGEALKRDLDRAPQRHESRRLAFARRSERVPRSRHHAALSSMDAVSVRRRRPRAAKAVARA